MGEGEEGLSVQELRAKRKAEKAAKMASKKKGDDQQKGGQQQKQQPKKEQQKGGKGKGKEGAKGKEPAKKEVPEVKKEEPKKEDKNTVSWFSDLQPYQESRVVGVQRQLHPKVVQLGLLYSQGKLVGSTARCVALLRTLQYVIQDYKVPPNKGIRHLSAHLQPSISFLFSCRVPPPASMTNAVTWLHRKISKADESLSEEEAKTHFCDMIDEYVETRIQRAHEVITQSAVNKISDGDVVLTFSSSYIVEQVLLSAWREGKKFEVFVVDASPFYHGKTLLHKLQENGLKCSYSLLTAATFVMKKVSKVFLGVSCLMSNGNAMARAGTSLVAMAAKSLGVPVLVCCESLKFTEKVWLDSIGQNELGNPDLILADVMEKLTAMGGNFEEKKKCLINKAKEDDETLGMNRSPGGLADGASLLDWKQRDNLKLLNLMYDVTPVGFIDVVVSDVGMMPPSSVAVVVRELSAEM